MDLPKSTLPKCVRLEKGENGSFVERAVTCTPRENRSRKFPLLLEEVLRVLGRENGAEIELAQRKLGIDVGLLELVALDEFDDVVGPVDGDQYGQCLSATLLDQRDNLVFPM